MSGPVAPVPGSPSVPVWRPSAPGDGTSQMLLAGAVAGMALPVLYVTWLNRGGPGEVCHPRVGGQDCLDAWSPWPTAGVAVTLLVAAGLLLRSGLGARRGAVTSGAKIPARWLGAGWALVGALGCFSVLSMLTIGAFIAPVAVLLAVVLLARRNPLTAGLLAAAAAYPLIVIAVLHRQGPIDACHTVADGGLVCEHVPDPWPFALGAAVCLAVAATLLTAAVRRRRSSDGVGAVRGEAPADPGESPSTH